MSGGGLEESGIKKTEGDCSADVCSTFNLKPQDGASCCILLTSSASFSLKYPLNREFDYVIGDFDSAIGDSIGEILQTMKAGETKNILIPVEDNFDEKKEENNVDSDCATLSVTLCSFKNCKPIYQLTHEEKMNNATKHKAKGVELFKAQKILYSFIQFNKALKYLISMLPLKEVSESIQTEFNTLRVQCYSNIAACQLNLGSYNYVVTNCTKALTIDPGNVKCLYRRAVAHFQLGKYDLCSCDVKDGLKCEPKSKSFQELMRKVAEK